MMFRSCQSICVCLRTNWTSSATTEIARDAWNGHSRSLKVIRFCANRHGIYDFLLAVNSNLTSVFNRSEISRLVCTSIYSTSLPGGTEKKLVVGGHALVSVSWHAYLTLWLDSTLSNHKVKSALKCTVWPQCTPVPDRQTDRRTDEHHGNTATIRSNERIAR